MYIDHGCKEKVARMDLKKFILHVKKKQRKCIVFVFMGARFCDHAWGRNTNTIFDLLTCSSNRTSLNLEHSPVFFEHPVYTRSPSLRKCGSFD